MVKPRSANICVRFIRRNLEYLPSAYSIIHIVCISFNKNRNKQVVCFLLAARIKIEPRFRENLKENQGAACRGGFWIF